MAGKVLNILSKLQCPHGGQVQIISANTRVKIGGTFAALATDTFVVTGCPFQIPATPPIPSPCVTVRWLVTDLKSRINGVPTLSESSSGLCLIAAQIPQGPVLIVATQPLISSQ